MLNNKFIKIFILIIIIALFIIVFIYIKKDNSDIDQNNNINTDIGTNTNLDSKPVNNNFINKKEDIDYTKNIIDDNNKNPETIIKENIEKKLNDWKISKDKNFLINALYLSENADNETILEGWIFFMKTDSNELIKMINDSNNIQKTKNTVKSIFDWYINLSGEYEKLSSIKKQELMSQYNMLK